MSNLSLYPQLALVAVLTWLRSRFDVREETGATAVEYGIMVALIAAVIVVAVTALGNHLSTIFSNACATINGNNAC